MKKSIAIIGEGETEWFYFDNAMKNGETLSELAALHPEDRIAYSQVTKVLRLLEHLKSENIR